MVLVGFLIWLVWLRSHRKVTHSVQEGYLLISEPTFWWLEDTEAGPVCRLACSHLMANIEGSERTEGTFGKSSGLKNFQLRYRNKNSSFWTAAHTLLLKQKSTKVRKPVRSSPSTIIPMHVTVNDNLRSRSVQGQWDLMRQTGKQLERLTGYYQCYSWTVTLLSADGQEHDVGFPAASSYQQTDVAVPAAEADRHLASVKFHKEQR